MTLEKDRDAEERLMLELASNHVMEYYGFHWPPHQLQIIFKGPKGVRYISHARMGGLIITVNRDEITRRFVIRSYKQQFVRVKSYQNAVMKARLHEKGNLNGNA